MARFTVSGGAGGGIPGPIGPEGDSAYEVAVANGFTGTEQEWLDSLGGGTANIADFIFTDDSDNNQSIISLPEPKVMRIESPTNDVYVVAHDDLYLESGDDIYIRTVGEADDISLEAADDIRFSTNNENSETETVHYWRMNSEGEFHLPGDGYISNPQAENFNSRVDTYSNNYLNDSSGLNNAEFIALPVDETTMWYVNNQNSFESQVLITFQDSTQAAATIIYEDAGLPAVIFQWQDGTRDKTFAETFPLNISVGYRTFSGNYTIVLDPANNGNDQRIVIDPTQPNHIHIRAGGEIDQSGAELILGGELANVRVVDWNHEVIVGSANAGTETTYNWNFNNNGVIYGPGNNGLTTFTKIYANSNDDSGENLGIGDDAWIGDVNVANHVGIKGIQEPTSGGIIFGSNRTERISVSGGDMNFWTDGGLYIGPSESGNQVVKQEDLQLVEDKTLPAGGVTGQVLTKVDEDDYNATWTDVSDVLAVSTRWSPTFEATGLTFTGTDSTYPTYNSYYVKVGKMVTFNIAIDLSTVTNFGTGQFKTALPFAPIPSAANHFSAWAWVDPTQPADELNGHVQMVADHLPNSQVLDLHWLKETTATPKPLIESILSQGNPVTFTTASKIYINGTYICQ